MPTETVPAIEGWFTNDGEAVLTGLRCDECSTLVFPPRATTCPNPACRGETLSTAALSRTGSVWSYATNHYAPPPPYVKTTEPFVPVTVVAVELDNDGLIVLGQLDGDVSEIKVGTPMELGAGELFTDDDGVRHEVWTWKVAS